MLRPRGHLLAAPVLHSAKAFSLMEVLVSVCIMSLSLLGIGYGMFHSEQSLKMSYYQTQALSLASSVAESAIALSTSLQEKQSQHQMAKHNAAQTVIFAANPNSYSHYVSIPARPPLVVFFQEKEAAQSQNESSRHEHHQGDIRDDARVDGYDDLKKILFLALHDYDDQISQTLPQGKLELESHGQYLSIKVLWLANQVPQSLFLDILLG